MKISTNIENINEELILILNLFRGRISKRLDRKEVYVDVFVQDGVIDINLSVDGKIALSRKCHYELDKNEKVSKYEKRYAKIALYEYLSKVTKYKAPWGSLTGIRPTKLYYEILKKTNNIAAAIDILKNEYLVSENKIQQVLDIAKSQSVVKVDHNTIDLYINIPFCVSKCYYCSFISMPLDKCKNLVEPYVAALEKDVRKTLEYIKQSGLQLNTVYVGGGTPTSIGVENLERVLKILPTDIKELTVEAGRPDSISKEMFDMLEKYNVHRISINPQTFNDKTLKLIGRKHTAEEVVEAYNLARKYRFQINMDLIAGLGKEKFADFKKTMEKTLSLNPDNITVHTLSIKRASTLKDGGETSEIKQVQKMVAYANKMMNKFGYKPYYLYRQKNMLGNLENIGYAKDGKICEFNINSMEETLSVIACGANAISKRIFYDTNCIERHANVKNIEQYIDRIDEMIEKKFELFSK